ncbi:MAG: DNA-directed DNA polymerase [Burkholderiales bacterium]|nr:DNA-directed DNA polymerase [Burkholderiales bacterium]
MSLRSLLVDFNSYFASVEQQMHPQLRGKPVGVVPSMAPTTCCIAASYEAKKFGVKTGTLLKDAKQLCPEIIFVEASHEHYVEFHERAKVAVDSVIPIRKVLSIDEVDCDLPPKARMPEAARELALKIKRAIYSQVGEHLHTSIGIGPNTFIAKTASDMMKPNGLVVIEKHELPHRLFGLKLRDLSGIGKSMEARLNRHGITTIEQMANLQPAQLHTIWGGVGGDRMYQRLHGEWVPDLETQTQSISHSHVLPPAERNDTDAYAILHRLTQKAAMRLRKMGYYASHMSVFMKFLNGPTWGRDSRFAETQDTVVFLRALDSMWQEKPKKRLLKPLAVGMVLHGLVHENEHTGTLFDNEDARHRLYDAIDQLNVKFGKNTVYFGGAHQARDSAPMRIAFNHIPDLETEQ